MGRVISLSGLPGVGKDTVSARMQELVTRAGSSAAIISIAHPLKVFTAALYNYSDAALWGPSERRTDIPNSGALSAHVRARTVKLPGGEGWSDERARDALDEVINALGEQPTARAALQAIGMWGRKWFTADVWVDVCVELIEARFRGHDGARAEVIIVPDVRFGNEVARMYYEFGKYYTPVALMGPLHSRPPREDAHESDRALFDEVVPECELVAWNSPATGQSGLSVTAHSILAVSAERACLP
jgi:hypothetical protein